MMFKTILAFLSLLFAVTFARAQTAEQVYDQYLDFNMARLKGETGKVLLIGESILPNVAKLPAKSQITYYAGLAKLYEDSAQPEKALTYYEIVAKAEPNYYVVHRALGYLYYNKVSEISKKLQTAKGDSKLMADYKAMVLKALPHLEKAEACDPSDDTLDMIKTLYTAINDTAGLNTLKGRLADLSKNCMSVLSE